MIRVAVLGAKGRMGATSCKAIADDADLELVAELDMGDPMEKITDAGADVCVDFTHPDAVMTNTSWLLRSGVHVVVGTTGLSAEDIDELSGLTGPANAIIAPNFAIGAVLMMVLSKQVAAHLPEVEIIESHRAGKADAPSGTALRTADLIAEGRSRGVEVPGPDGNPARGFTAGDVPIHSVRLPGMVAHQEVIFGGLGQTLTIRHDSIDRTSFMPGVVLAVKQVGRRPGLTVGLEHLLLP